jgi:DNA helicase-4
VCVGGRQPFPALRPDDPLLAGFLGAREDFPHAEERRLLYVALTRARHRVYLVGDRPSALAVLRGAAATMPPMSR